MLPLTNFFAIFIIFLVLPASSSVGERYETCSSSFFSCGKNSSDVGYPFWGGDRPKYCGHPSLQLQCLLSEKGDLAHLIIAQEKYAPYDLLSMKINYPNIILKLRGYDNITCSNFSKEYSDLFNITSNDESTTFVYNCPKHLSMGNLHNPFPCFGFPTHNYQAYYLHNMSAIREYESCSSFEFPVLKDQLDLYNQGRLNSFTEVLKQGFEVRYDYSSECINCMNWGGTCGSSDHSDFMCFYRKSSRLHGPVALIFLTSCVVSAFFAAGTFTLCCLRRRRSTIPFSIFWKSKATKCPNVDAFLQIYGSLTLTRHTYENIKKMTNCFKDRLGEGGYAIVYKGKLLNGRLIAVKVLKQSKGDGEDFLNEVASISRTNHVNIVALLGFCFEGNKRALIYEYLPNGSLEKFTFHGTSAINQSLPWETLFNIAIGIAKGLDYLHRGCNARILHFDIKPHNILLDENFCPKISDFGLARLCPLQVSTILMMEARGTIGYIAPEVFCRTIGGVSHKSDVYSFGMMVLDMVCGRKNLSADQQRSSQVYFPQWIYDRLEVESESPFEGTTNAEEKVVQRKMILVSLWCIQTYPSDRPSMNRVVDMLHGCLESIDMPPQRNLSSPPRLVLDTSGTFTEISD
ncbi:LEAF RUST 10 DISEASE-RESISTANCE LOCUS RECEPTOR-LIKE PROTEIN KINASE-like 2.4 [Silene latifolia]|uniref:LEAF RUST 10 DISEASE-RESISTANCE LOCUS RECEPTOR-LIKE PROTEIN KINASE-like 2.4 n=1 Tax=Silene latifolia TaxID=37657 RepID=UPI003D76BCCB